jgi:hypothetical protein
MKVKPHWKVLQKLEYIPDYCNEHGNMKPELRKAYAKLATNNPQGMRELIRYDHRVAYRDWLYDSRKSNLSDGLQGVSDIDTMAMIADLNLPGICKCIAKLMVDGYLGYEIADMLGISDCVVSRYKHVIARSVV